jgi:hypothetical protein
MERILTQHTLDHLRGLYADHGRSWRDNSYVYPVISRRAGGLSIGINLNPDKACNFDCVYCQVDRTVPPVVRQVDPERLRIELERMLAVVLSGEFWKDPQFAHVPESHRRLVDMAFSGDGEPTTSPQFGYAVQLAAGLRRELGLTDTKLVLITDAAYLHKPAVRETLAVMDANNGEIWAKLDAGTEEYYRLINRPNVPLQVILDNILDAARVRPIVIQSLWMNCPPPPAGGTLAAPEPPPAAEIDAFAGRLRDIIAAGGRIRLVQIYTIARRTAEPFVTPLDQCVLEAIADRVRAVIDVPVMAFA